jgi:predicted MFS family arabinose efflux permease
MSLPVEVAARGTPASAKRVPAATWWTLGVLAAINLFGNMDRMALTILLEPIKAEFGATDQQLGLLMGFAFILFYSVLGIPLARLADRSSRVRLLSICLLLWSMMTALCGLAQNFQTLVLARVGVGIGEAGCMPPAHSLIGDYFPREKRALAISLLQAGAALGAAVGMGLVGYLGQEIGWRATLQIIGLAGLPLAAIAILTLREPARPASAAHAIAGEPARAAFAALLKRRAYVHLVIGYSVGSICTAGESQWLPSYLRRAFGMGMGEVGGWIGLTSLVGATGGLVVGGLLANWLVRRNTRWELWLPTLANVAYLPVFVVVVLSPTAELAIAFHGLAVFLGAIAGGVGLAAVQAFAEPNRRATAVALLLFLVSLMGLGVGSYLIGLMSDLLAPQFGVQSLRYALLATGLAQIWGTVHVYLASRHAEIDRVN